MSGWGKYLILHQTMIIKILWSPWCSKCKFLELVVQNTLSELSIKADIQNIQDLSSMMDYHISSVPWLVIDEKLVISGYVPDFQEMIDILQKYKKI